MDDVVEPRRRPFLIRVRTQLKRLREIIIIVIAIAGALSGIGGCFVSQEEIDKAEEIVESSEERIDELEARVKKLRRDVSRLKREKAPSTAKRIQRRPHPVKRVLSRLWIFD